MNYEEIYNEAFEDELDKLAGVISRKERFAEAAEGAGVVGAGAGGLAYGLSSLLGVDDRSLKEKLMNLLRKKTPRKMSRAGKLGLSVAAAGAALGGIEGYSGMYKRKREKDERKRDMKSAIKLLKAQKMYA